MTVPIQPSDHVSALLAAAGEVDAYELVITQPGRLVMRTQGHAGFDTRTSLFAADGRLLMQSDGESLSDPDDRIVQNLDTGIYVLEVGSVGTATGRYSLTTAFSSGPLPFRPIRAGEGPWVITSDFNGDGRTDLATVGSNDISVLLGRGDGTFKEVASFLGGDLPFDLLSGDFDNDGRTDLATANFSSNDVSVLLGRGDGTFQDAVSFPVGNYPRELLSGDFDGDGRTDLATANVGSNDVSVLLGRGDGTFQAMLSFPVGGAPFGMLSADFNGDGTIDLATDNVGSDQSKGDEVTVLLGRGDGTFPQASTIPTGEAVGALLSGDFNGDGRLDLATADLGPVNPETFRIEDDPDVNVLLGRGDGTFQEARSFPVGSGPESLLSGDFNGDGRIDLATANVDSNDVSVLLGRGDGTFQAMLSFPVGEWPNVLLSGDFNGDGRTDLATANLFSDDISVLLGRGDGTFKEMLTSRALDGPYEILSEDLDGDNRPDIVAVNSDEVSVLLGRGDGSFQDAGSPLVEDGGTGGSLSADFNLDGRPDLTTASSSSDEVSVLLGRGDGTLQDPVSIPLGDRTLALLSADFNNDGRPDLASANAGSFNSETNRQEDGSISVLLGRGDGTFQALLSFPVGEFPFCLLSGDFNGDGWIDLATANWGRNNFETNRYEDSSVSVLLGRGDGTFQAMLSFPVGESPYSLLSGDFNGDGRPDLATANAGSNDISVLLGRGDGTFQDAVSLSIGEYPDSLLSGDFNRDGCPDFVAANGGHLTEAGQWVATSLAIVLGLGDGTFQDALYFPVEKSPGDLLADDFNGDGWIDLAMDNWGGFNPETSQADGGDVAVMLGRGDGTFQDALYFPVGSRPIRLLSEDFNGDGRADLANINGGSSDHVAVLLGRGDGTFEDALSLSIVPGAAALLSDDFNRDGRPDLVPGNGMTLLGTGNASFKPGSQIAFQSLRSTPLLADVDGNGIADSLVVSRNGDISYRRGQADPAGSFAPPLIVNPANAPARAVTVVRVGARQLIAAVNQREGSLTIYSLDAHARPTVVQTLAAEPFSFPTRIVAGNLAGDEDGFDDLAVLNAFTGSVSVFLSDGAGRFTPGISLAADGSGPVDLSLADVTGDGLSDILLANQLSGDLTVLTNGGGNRHFTQRRLRAGAGPFGVADFDSGSVFTLDQTGPVTVGDFNHDEQTDIVAPNTGSNSFSILFGRGDGSFANPALHLIDFSPTLVVAGQFNDDNQDGRIDDRDHLDLAFLDAKAGTVRVGLGGGNGTFAFARLRSGTQDFNLRLETLEFSAGNVPTGLSVHDVNGDGRLDLQIGNEFGDVLTLLGNGDGTFQPYRRAETAVALAAADLNGDGEDDFIFADKALDNIAVQFSQPGVSFVQDRDDGLLAPGAVSVADLNRDGLQDLVVANSGANNVLVYLGTGGGQFAPARSFFAGTNPVAVAVAFLKEETTTDPATGQLMDLTPDLVVANHGSNDVSVLFGRGSGAEWTLSLGPRRDAGQGPVAVTVSDINGDGKPDILASNSQSDDVSVVRGLGLGGFVEDTPIPVGTSPGPIFVGNFDGNPGPDLVTLNPAANSLTFFSNLGPGVTIATGGGRPIAGVVTDLNADGFDDLFVANNADGLITFLVGGLDGLELGDETFADPAVPHPTGLALSPTGQVLYVSGERESQFARFLLDAGPQPVSSPGTNGPASVETPRQVTVELGTVAQEALALVPALVIGEAQAVKGDAAPARGEAATGGGTPLTAFLLGLNGGGSDDPAAKTAADPAEGVRRWLSALAGPAEIGMDLVRRGGSALLEPSAGLFGTLLSSLGGEGTAVSLSDVAADVATALLRAGKAALGGLKRVAPPPARSDGPAGPSQPPANPDSHGPDAEADESAAPPASQELPASFMEEFWFEESVRAAENSSLPTENQRTEPVRLSGDVLAAVFASAAWHVYGADARVPRRKLDDRPATRRLEPGSRRLAS